MSDSKAIKVGIVSALLGLSVGVGATLDFVNISNKEENAKGIRLLHDQGIFERDPEGVNVMFSEVGAGLVTSKIGDRLCWIAADEGLDHGPKRVWLNCEPKKNFLSKPTP